MVLILEYPSLLIYKITNFKTQNITYFMQPIIIKTPILSLGQCKISPQNFLYLLFYDTVPIIILISLNNFFVEVQQMCNIISNRLWYIVEFQSFIVIQLNLFQWTSFYFHKHITMVLEVVVLVQTQQIIWILYCSLYILVVFLLKTPSFQNDKYEMRDGC